MALGPGERRWRDHLGRRAALSGPDDAGPAFLYEILDVLNSVRAEISDPDRGGIPGALPAAQRCHPIPSAFATPDTVRYPAARSWSTRQWPRRFWCP